MLLKKSSHYHSRPFFGTKFASGKRNYRKQNCPGLYLPPATPPCECAPFHSIGSSAVKVRRRSFDHRVGEGEQRTSRPIVFPGLR
jgi:hypothetical protein